MRAGWCLNNDGEFVPDSQPFHCKCHVHEFGMVWADVFTVEQWGKVGGLAELLAREAFDDWSGDTSDVFTQGNTPWRDGKRFLVSTCWDKYHTPHNCWKSNYYEKSDDQRPVIPEGYSCMSWGLRAAGTMSYVTMQVGEILSVLTYRCDDFSLRRFFTNPVYLLALIVNLIALLVFVYFPMAREILGFAPLEEAKMLFSIFLGVLVMALNEIWKIFYRVRLAAQNEQLASDALDQALRIPGEGPPTEQELATTQTPDSIVLVKKQYGQLPGLGPGRQERDKKKGSDKEDSKEENGDKREGPAPLQQPLLDASAKSLESATAEEPAKDASNEPALSPSPVPAVSPSPDPVWGLPSPTPASNAGYGLNMVATAAKVKRAAGPAKKAAAKQKAAQAAPRAKSSQTSSSTQAKLGW